MATKKTIPIKQVTSWSFSRYSDYKQCPLKAKLKHIDKISEPPNEAMARGAQIHNLAEDFIKGKVPKLAPELKLFEKEFKRLRAMFKKISQSMVVEDNWAFTKDWDETAWNNWTACWVRIKLDCAHHEEDTVLVVTDWKTGKFRPEQNEEYVEQLELYALSALLLHDHIEEVRPIGAVVTVTAAKSVPINIAATYTGAADVAAFKAAVKSYLGKITKAAVLNEAEAYVSIARIGALLVDAGGVTDYSSLTLNGATSNIPMAEEEMPSMGEVALSV